MSDTGEPSMHEVRIDTPEDVFARQEVAQANADLNAIDELGFLLPGQFHHQGDLRLFEMPTDDKVIEGE